MANGVTLGGPGGVAQFVPPKPLTVKPATIDAVHQIVKPYVSPANALDIAHAVGGSPDGLILQNNLGDSIVAAPENENLVLHYVTNPATLGQPSIVNQLLGIARNNGMRYVVGAVPNSATGLNRLYRGLGAAPYRQREDGFMLWSYPPRGQG